MLTYKKDSDVDRNQKFPLLSFIISNERYISV